MSHFNLVTGGAGFIGRHLTDGLLRRGERVRVLDISDQLPMPPEVEFVRGSVTDPETVREALQGVTRVYHLAANPNLWCRDRRNYSHVNVRGTYTVFQETARCELDRIVFTSTESILKSWRRSVSDGLNDGSATLTIADMAGLYCRSKFVADRLALAAAQRGQPVVIVNPTMPIGPGDHHMTPPMKMLLRFLEGRAPAYLETEFNLIHVEDAAIGHILAADHGRIGERYVLGGENLLLRDLLRLLEEVSGLPMPRAHIPYWVALSAASISEFLSNHILSSPPIAPVTGVRLAATSMTFDCSRSIAELGLPQRPARQAIADAVDWFFSEGKISPHRVKLAAANGGGSRALRPAANTQAEQDHRMAS